MRVEFIRTAGGHAGVLAQFVMDAVPCGGDAVVLPGREPLIAWGVAWRLDCAEPVAQVELVTRQERDLRIRR